MQSKPCNAFFLEYPIAIKQLFAGKSILRFFWVANYYISFPCRPWIVSEADNIRNPGIALQKRNMANVIQIDYSSQLSSFFILICWSVIGSKHYFFSI